MLSLYTSVIGAGVVMCVFSYITYSMSRLNKNLPPGPPRLPLIGNIHQLPSTGAHRKFTEWAKIYGGLFSLKLGPATAVVVTDRRLVKEMFDKKSSLYSSRPPSYVSHDLITKGDHLLVMNNNDTWRSFRKMIHQHFAAHVCEKQHMQLVEAEGVQMMRDFLVHPEEHMLHSKRTSNSIIMSLLYGIRTESCHTEHLVELYDIMERWSEVMEVGATPPVDIFPILKLLPEAWFGNWIQRSLDVGKRMKSLYETTLVKVYARRLVHGSGTTFMDEVLNQKDKLNLTQHQREFLGGVMMEGGSETISTMMLVILQALTLHPEVQKRAQNEIDQICSEDRSPNWSDYDRLPYISMIIKESVRWRPVTPLGFPHALAKDDIVDGYSLPKGSAVFLNIWGLHYDETIFPNPNKFDPSRFAGKTKLAADYAASADYMDRDHYIYGAGRRICPGIHLAEREMFVGTAKLLWGFDFGQECDGDGCMVPIDTDPETGYTEGFLTCPKDFGCRVTPRSSRRAETIMREFERADREVFSRYRENVEVVSK